MHLPDQQPTYQNQGAFPPPLMRSTTAPGLGNGIRAPAFAAQPQSVSPRQQQQQQQQQQQRIRSPAFNGGPHQAAAEEQAFYQNVNNSNRFVPPQHFPSPGGTPREVVQSGELFHATPRISGTPGASMTPNSTSMSTFILSDLTKICTVIFCLIGEPPGPEKPQRQYAYNHQEPQIQTTPTKKTSQNNLRGVRFQEPSVEDGNNKTVSLH